MRPLAMLVLFALTACGPVSSRPRSASPTARVDGIVNGVLAPNDHGVFMLTRFGEQHCSASLIAPRTLLTAAHCVEGEGVLGATNAPSLGQMNADNRYDVMEMLPHPLFASTSSFDADVALVLLDRPSGAPLVELNRADLFPLVGSPIRHVGYGVTTTTGTDSGQRRTVTDSLRLLQDDGMGTGDSTVGVCFGDSGGAALLVRPDGTEVVAGVHSHLQGSDCGGAIHTRVDLYASFIDTWLTVHEVPTCERDFACRTDCAAPDPDCACLRDGECGRCGDLDDPDCPTHCKADGVCSEAACPRPDSDCVALGAACARPESCASRACVSDAQNAETYCSRSCTSTADCPAAMECDVSRAVCIRAQLPQVPRLALCEPGINWCGPSLVCAAIRSEPRACLQTCEISRQCLRSEACVDSKTMKVRVCAPLDPVTLPRLSTESLSAAPGCASVPGALLCAVGALALLRRRRAS